MYSPSKHFKSYATRLCACLLHVRCSYNFQPVSALAFDVKLISRAPPLMSSPAVPGRANDDIVSCEAERQVSWRLDTLPHRRPVELQAPGGATAGTGNCYT